MKFRKTLEIFGNNIASFQKRALTVEGSGYLTKSNFANRKSRYEGIKRQTCAVLAVPLESTEQRYSVYEEIW